MTVAEGVGRRLLSAPSGAVTGIGSLPIEKPSAAIEFVATFSPQLPFCPQPPAPDPVTTTLTQLDELSHTRTRFEMFADAAMRGAFPEAVALKTQVTGPITLAGLLRAAGEVQEIDPTLVMQLARRVMELVRLQIRGLLGVGLPVLVYVDEPALVLVEPPLPAVAVTPLTLILQDIRHAGGIAGLHCCTAGNPGAFSELPVEVVSFDATSGSLPPSPIDMQVLSDSERLISFGLVPASEPPPSTTDAFSRWLVTASSTGDPCQLAYRTIVTTSCGLGAVDLTTAVSAFAAATSTGNLIRQLVAS